MKKKMHTKKSQIYIQRYIKKKTTSLNLKLKH